MRLSAGNEMAKVRITGLGMFLLSIVFFSGCSRSPSELLVGRWYSGDMTIRFREDSAVIWNSPQGLAKGRFEFTGKTSRVHTDEKSPNLFLDVIRNDERRQFRFQIGFIGQDRLRMDLIPMDPNSIAPGASTYVVLRRANDNTLGGAPTQVAQR